MGQSNWIRIHKLNFVDYIELYVLCAALKSGLFDLALKISDVCFDSAKVQKRFAALLVKIDLLVLLIGWNRNLSEYYNKKIWFDFDKFGFQDCISNSFLFATHDNLIIYVNKIEQLEILNSNKDLMFAFLKIMVVYYQNSFDFEKAFEFYKKSIFYSKERVFEKYDLNIHNDFFADGEILNVFVSLASIENQFFDKLTSFFIAKNITLDQLENFKIGESKTLNNDNGYSFSVCYSYHERLFKREFRYSSVKQKLFRCKNIWCLYGGILVSCNKDHYYFIIDTSNLDFNCLNLFAHEIVAYDFEKSVIKKRFISPFVCERAFVVNDTGWSYYHWMYETIPCVKVYFDSGLNHEMPIIFPYKLTKWQKDSLRLFFGENINIFQKSVYECIIQDAYFANKSSRDLIPSSESISFLNAFFSRYRKDSAQKTEKRIYISRRNIESARSMINADEVEKWAQSHGFIKVDPLDMNFEEQAYFFSDVDFILAEGGAALSNLVMCPPYTKVIVMAASRAWSETFSSLAARLGQNFIAIFGDSHPAAINQCYIWTAFDFSISIADLDHAYAYLVRKNQEHISFIKS